MSPCPCRSEPGANGGPYPPHSSVTPVPKRGAMHLHPRPRIDIAATCARALQLCREVQYTRWVAAQARHRARLTRLAWHMPQANPLTLTITAQMLATHGLLAPEP